MALRGHSRDGTKARRGFNANEFTGTGAVRRLGKLPGSSALRVRSGQANMGQRLDEFEALVQFRSAGIRSHSSPITQMTALLFHEI